MKSNVSSLMRNIDEAVSYLLDMIREGRPILVISHYDADGLAAAAIMVKVLSDLEAPFHLKIWHQVDDIGLESISSLEGYGNVIFLDMGSGCKSSIVRKLKNWHILIVDHHEPEDVEVEGDVVEVNPHRHGIDGGIEISSSGLIYLVAKRLDSRYIRLSHLAIVGALADRQDKGDKHSLIGLNRFIVEEAVQSGIVKEELSLRLYGLRSKPLVKCLEQSIDPYLPGLTGNEIACYRFLKRIGIEPEVNGKLRMFSSLSKDEVKLLVTSLIKYLIDLGFPSKVAEDIIGYAYLINITSSSSPLHDAREFASLVNACGRLGKYGLAIALCLGDKEALEEAIKASNEYRSKLARYLNKVYRGDIVRDEGLFYCIEGDKAGIEEKIIGAIASIVSSSKLLPDDKPVVALALSRKGYLKVSARRGSRNDIDLNDIMKKAAEAVGGVGGGHQAAAGALIPAYAKEDFIKQVKLLMRGYRHG
ncbi:MAG: hypothetical protein DRN15_03070 [Thermoprotei archaeon]|nr:MAG: hypothetical protein DRN15_03070 [Thermoprotei archaeon]RLF25048.1 MAG: hypothetical protein DRM97_02475 [Thermoprotei archaeon]